MAAYSVELPFDRYCKELFVFLVAAVIIRSSACTINDIFDREYDAGVGGSIAVFVVTPHFKITRRTNEK